MWQQQHMETSSSPVSESCPATRFPLGSGGIPSGDIRRNSAGLNSPPPNQIRDPNAWGRFLPDVTLSDGLHKNFELIVQPQ